MKTPYQSVGIKVGGRRSRAHILWAGLAATALLTLPFASLLWHTPWQEMQFVHGDGRAIFTSIVYTLIALLIDILVGTPLAWWLARYKFCGKMLVEALVLVPLLAPPLVIGLLLTMSFGPYGWLAGPFHELGIRLTNTPQAFVMAQVYASAPYFIVAARSAFEAVPAELEHVALTLGRAPTAVFLRITLPLSALGLGAGLALAWVRALGEFGTVLIVAYFPKGMPVKLWVNLQNNGLDSVYPLLWVFFAVALPLPLALGLLSRRQLKC